MFSVVFDMDGVLLDTENSVIEDGWMAAASTGAMGIMDMDYLRKVCLSVVGTNEIRTREIFLESFGEKFDYDLFRRMADEQISAHRDAYGIPVKEGAREILQYLKGMKVKLALASSTRRSAVTRELEEAGLLSFFDEIVTGDMIVNSKPAPDIYLKACELLGEKPENCFAVEDSLNGAISASDAGMRLLVVPDLIVPTREVRERAEGVFENLLDAKDYLSKQMYTSGESSARAREEFFASYTGSEAFQSFMNRAVTEEEGGAEGVEPTYRCRLIPEECYAQVMREQVEPDLVQVMNDGYCYVSENVTIHYAYYTNPDMKGTIVIIHGYTENTWKYREMTYYFWKAGYQVFLMDLRGHGASTRETADDYTVHIGKFSEYVDDLEVVFEQKLEPILNGMPVHLFAHSMGCAVATLYLKRHPDRFERCIMSAPLVEMNLGKHPTPAKLLARGGMLFGAGNRMLPTCKPYDSAKYVFENNKNATSKPRFDYYRLQRERDSRYQTNSPSCAWMWNAINIKKEMLAPESYPRKMQTQILILEAETDFATQKESTVLFAQMLEKITATRRVVIEGSRHTIFFSGNKVLRKYMDEIMIFLDGDGEN